MAKQRTSQQDLQDTAQQIFLAGLGALSRAEEEGSKFFQKLVQRGRKYDGPGAAQLDVLAEQVEAAMLDMRDRTSRAQSETDVDARKKEGKGVGEQLARVRESLGSVVEGVEGNMENALASALTSLGMPTRAELEGLQRTLQELASRLEGSEAEGAPTTPSKPDVLAVPAADGWFEIRVHDIVVDRVQGREAADRRVAQLGTQSSTSAESSEPKTREVTIEPTGGGWYEVLVNGEKVDKVQGRRAAEAAVRRHEMAE